MDPGCGSTWCCRVGGQVGGDVLVEKRQKPGGDLRQGAGDRVQPREVEVPELVDEGTHRREIAEEPHREQRRGDEFAGQAGSKVDPEDGGGQIGVIIG